MPSAHRPKPRRQAVTSSTCSFVSFRHFGVAKLASRTSRRNSTIPHPTTPRPICTNPSSPRQRRHPRPESDRWRFSRPGSLPSRHRHLRLQHLHGVRLGFIPRKARYRFRKSPSRRQRLKKLHHADTPTRQHASIMASSRGSAVSPSLSVPFPQPLPSVSRSNHSRRLFPPHYMLGVLRHLRTGSEGGHRKRHKELNLRSPPKPFLWPRIHRLRCCSGRDML